MRAHTRVETWESGGATRCSVPSELKSKTLIPSAYGDIRISTAVSLAESGDTSAGWQVVLSTFNEVLMFRLSSSNHHNRACFLQSEEVLVLSPEASVEWVDTGFGNVTVASFTDRYLDHIARDVLGKRTEFEAGVSIIEAKDIAGMISLAVKHHDEDVLVNDAISRHYVDIALIRLISKLSLHPTGAKENRGAVGGQLSIQQLCDKLLAEPGQAIAVDDMSEACGLSRTKFLTQFKTIMKMSPAAYIRNLRARRAVELIRETDRKLTDIASYCGFCDQAHMSRVVKSITGKTPRQFR